jgi:hypothetical protein
MLGKLDRAGAPVFEHRTRVDEPFDVEERALDLAHPQNSDRPERLGRRKTGRAYGREKTCKRADCKGRAEAAGPGDRGARYLAAGADCVYPIAAALDADTIRFLSRAFPDP